MKVGTDSTVMVRPALPQVNLLPPEFIEFERLHRMQRGMLCVVLGAGLLVLVLLMLGHGAAGDAQRSLDAAHQQHDALLARQSSLREVPAVEAALAARQAQLAQALGSEIDWMEQLQQLSLRMPAHVYLKSLTATQNNAPGVTAPAVVPGAVAGVGNVAFSGTAASHDDVVKWLRALAALPGYSTPTLSTSAEKELGGRILVDFTSAVVLTEQAESGRYKVPGHQP